MIRLLLVVCMVAGLGAAAAWLANHPGNVTIFWFDWRIDTSFAFLLMLASVAIFLISYLYIFLRALFLAPARFAQHRQTKSYEKGLTQLTYSIAALAASDVKTAQLHARKAEKTLGETPITLLLSAQIARNEGDEEKTQLYLTKMLDHKETEYLATRSLSDTANKQKLFSKALPLAQRATDINPKEKTSAVSLVGLHIHLSQWQQALQAANKATRKGALLRSERRYYRGIINLKQGMELLKDGQAESALSYAQTALKQLHNFTPAIIFNARALIACENNDKAIKLIIKNWKTSPNVELANVLRVAMAKEPEEKQLKYAQKLIAILPQHPESHLALAETAVKLKEWEIARKSLKIALEKEDSIRACKLMAYIEQGEFSDFDAAGRWLGRSADSQPDSVWMCSQCSNTTEKWDTHCGQCNAFDTLTFKQPTIQFVE